jgi:tetratricopeptide (TPR) repeat protein
MKATSGIWTKKTRAARRAILSCVVAGLAGATMIAPVTAAVPPEQVEAFGQTTEAERVRILIGLAKNGGGDDAEYLLKRFPLQGTHAANRTLYIEGLILKSRGELTEATAKFRHALADDPKLTLVRSDLAQTLYELEEDESAMHHLKLLQADAPDAAAVANIKAFIDRVDARNPFSFNTYISLAPTNNINSASKHASIILPNGFSKPNDIPQKSGMGVAVGTNASYSKRLGDDWFLIGSGGIDGRVYDKSEFNGLTLSQAIEARHLTDGGYVGLAAVASQSVDTKAEEFDYLSYGPRVSFRHSIDGRSTFAGSILYEFRDYPDASYRDGTAIKVDANWTYALDSTASFTLSPGYTRVRSNELTFASHNSDYDTASFGVNGYKELSFGITLDGGIEYQDTQFVHPFSFIYEKRHDNRIIATMNVTKRDLNFFGFAPSFSYTYTHNRSNFDFFDFDIHEVDLRLTKEF